MTPAANAVPSTRPPRSRSAAGRRISLATNLRDQRPRHGGMAAVRRTGASTPGMDRAPPHSHPQLRQSLPYAVASH